jgi:hypothetical protein
MAQSHRVSIRLSIQMHTWSKQVMKMLLCMLVEVEHIIREHSKLVVSVRSDFVQDYRVPHANHFHPSLKANQALSHLIQTSESRVIDDGHGLVAAAAAILCHDSHHCYSMHAILILILRKYAKSCKYVSPKTPELNQMQDDQPLHNYTVFRTSYKRRHSLRHSLNGPLHLV